MEPSGLPITDLPQSPKRLEVRDRRPDASKALDRAASLLLDRLQDLRSEDLEDISVLDCLKLAAKLEQATQARKSADALAAIADLPAEELDARIAARQARLDALRSRDKAVS